MDRIYLPVRCPGCSKMSVTSLPVGAAEMAANSGHLQLRCLFDRSEWLASVADCERLQRLIDEHAIVASVPWFHLTSGAFAQVYDKRRPPTAIPEAR